MGWEPCNKKNEARHDFKLLSYGMAREKIGTCLILSADANFLYLFVWLLVLNTCGAIQQEKKIRTLIHWNTFKSMKSVGLYFSLCFASDSCYCNISYATVITHDFKKILISDILLLNLTISLQGERNAQVNYKLLTTMAKKYWLLFEEKRNLKVHRKTG